MVLIILLALSNWDHVLLLFSWFYALASRWMTTSTIPVIYGLVLVYLLLVVHGLAVTQDATRKRRKNPFVPYYDENGTSGFWRGKGVYNGTRVLQSHQKAWSSFN
ncbi:hypothetical protein C8R44DRAFT_751084 [Mycena epipterygia]|nr:hypothetical protein C8R44DRAFT_751084 [Mycena epipterygia]